MLLNVYADYTRVIGSVNDEVLSQIDDVCSFDVEGANFSEKVQRGYWDGRKHLFSKKTGLFPTGLLSRVQDVLSLNGVQYGVKDNRVEPVFGEPIPLVGKEPYDWQHQVLDTCIREKRGVIKIATGGGKSFMQTYLVGKLNCKTIILVNKLDILLQFKDWMETGLGIAPGIVGGGTVKPSNITLMMVQTAANALRIKPEGLKEKDVTALSASTSNIIKQTLSEAECVIGDEVHGLVSRTWYNMHRYFKRAYIKLGWSATPGYLESKNLLLEAAFGPRLIDITCSDLIRSGYLTQPHFYFVNLKHDRVNADVSYQQVYAQEVTENEYRNLLATKLAVDFWTKGRRVLIGVQHLKHGQILEKMIGKVIGKEHVQFIRGETDTEIRQNTLKALNEGEARMVIATKVFSEGVDVKYLDVLINAKAQVSYIDYLQLIGRVLRKAEGKHRAWVIDFYDYGCRYLTQHSKERMTIALNESEFKVHKIEAVNILPQ